MSDDDKNWLSEQFGRVEQQVGEVKLQVGTVEQRLDSLEEKVDRNDASLRKELLSTEHRMIEAMRDMQTELLRGFQAFAVPQGIRLRKVEVDQSNLDSSMSGRMEVLEKRLYQIEMRLFGGDQEGTAKH